MRRGDPYLPVSRWLTLATVVALLVAACAGGESDPRPADGGTAPTDRPAAATLAAGPDQPPAGSGDDQTVAVNRTVWNYGFEWEVREATLSGEVNRLLGRETRNLIVTVRLTNHGPEAAGFRGEAAAVFERGGSLFGATTGTVWVDVDSGSGLEVPSGESGEGVLRFAVPVDFELERGFLLIGERTDNQAVVPFGSAGPQLVDLAPHLVDITGEITMEVFDLIVTQVRLSADLPHRNRALPAGERALYVDFDFTHRRQGKSSLAPPSFELSLPDGTTAEPANWGPDYAFLAPNTAHSLWLRFPIEMDDPSGEYVLTFTPGRLLEGSDEPDSHALAFTVDAAGGD